MNESEMAEMRPRSESEKEAYTLVEKFTEMYGRTPEAVAFAPGRIEIIGNHTDYNGGSVLGAAIDRGVWVGISSRIDGRLRLVSDLSGRDLKVVDVPSRPLVRREGDDHWINFPLGVLAVLPAFGFEAPVGFDFLALSDLPVGAGLSSSAAIELASALAFLALSGQICPRAVLAQIGRKAENEFVGVPCGILDQAVSAFGETDHLVQIDCRNQVIGHIPFSPDANLWVFNTHTKHSLVDSLYKQRHRECLEAAAQLGVPLLADVTVDGLDAAEHKMTETNTRRARHVIGEIARVRRVVGLLARHSIAEVGRLLTQSHRSSQRLFENSTSELDYLVDVLLEQPGVHGARLTGGGFGGAVLALTGPEFTSTDAGIVESLYKMRYQAAPEVFRFRCSRGAHVLSALDTSARKRVGLVGEARA